jgi:hypothetical protein
MDLSKKIKKFWRIVNKKRETMIETGFSVYVFLMIEVISPITVFIKAFIPNIPPDRLSCAIPQAKLSILLST